MAIQNNLERLKLKIDEIEEKLNNLYSKKETEEYNGISVFKNKLLNLKVSSTKTITIKTLHNELKNQIFFQLKINFYNFSQQEIKFSLHADKIQIGQETKNFTNGLNEIIIFGTYQNQISDKIKIELSITPKDKKQVTIIETILTTWGVSKFDKEEYNALETDDSYFLSYISNNRLYYKIFNKTSEVESHDFIFLTESISHCACCIGNQIFIFRVDLNGNLFFGDLSSIHEIFIANNVSQVSCCYSNESIIFAYISNGDVYYGEIKNNLVISNNQLKSPYGKYMSSYLFFNNINKKTYMVLTKKDNSNYLLEDIAIANSSSENINAITNLIITT